MRACTISPKLKNVAIGYESHGTNKTHNGGIKKEAMEPHNNTTTHGKWSDTFDKDGNLQKAPRAMTKDLVQKKKTEVGAGSEIIEQ